jgi:hypothetical protein
MSALLIGLPAPTIEDQLAHPTRVHVVQRVDLGA